MPCLQIILGNIHGAIDSVAALSGRHDAEFNIKELGSWHILILSFIARLRPILASYGTSRVILVLPQLMPSLAMTAAKLVSLLAELTASISDGRIGIT